MVAFNFTKKYVPKIESGEKYTTIRPTRRCKPGDKLQLYTGMRTRKVRLLKVAECVSVDKISIYQDHVEGLEMENEEFLEMIGSTHSSYEEFIRDFGKEYGLPCTGYLVVWKDIPK